MTNQEICNRLKMIEQEKDVRILLAVECGSRAWGFASPDSDWDVRFIYVHPVEWYLTVNPGHDVIEVTDGDFDASGWDLRKALQLYRKTNPSMLEWLSSPIKYIDDEAMTKKLLQLNPVYFNITRAIHHYFHLSESHNERYLLRNGITLKRFLYYLRGLLACKWIMGRGTPVPVLFNELVEATIENSAVIDAVNRLVAKKSQSKEHDKDDVEPLLIEYASALSEEVQRFLERNQPDAPDCNRDYVLDKFLSDMILKQGKGIKDVGSSSSKSGHAPVDFFDREANTLDIRSNGHYPSNVLSNLCSNAFELDGVLCNSMEGFLQSLKREDVNKQREICSMKGGNARKKSITSWQTDQIVWWQGKALDRQGEHYQELLRRAYQAMFDQNERFRAALMSTRGTTLCHTTGESDPYKTIITPDEFCTILSEIRDSYDRRDKNI